MRTGRGIICGVFAALVLCIAPQIIHAQIVASPPEQTPLENTSSPEISSTGPTAGTPINVTLVGIVDGGGQDRYGVVVLRRGDWLLEDINWVNRAGTDAASLLLAGRRLHVDRLEISLLAGPWYEYANRAWDEAVIDTNVQFDGERFRFVSINHWGVPVRPSGGFFDSHVVTVTGIPEVPKWLGASGQIEHSSSDSIGTLWAGLVFTKKRSDISLSGVPYWDFQHHRAGLRLTVSYHLALETTRGQNNVEK